MSLSIVEGDAKDVKDLCKYNFSIAGLNNNIIVARGRGGLAVPTRFLKCCLRMTLELMGSNPCPYNLADYMLTP
jgi:hypothetical protein